MISHFDFFFYKRQKNCTIDISAQELLTAGSGYTIKKVYFWTRNPALEKAATGLGSLETPTRIITGGKLDF